MVENRYTNLSMMRHIKWIKSYYIPYKQILLVGTVKVKPTRQRVHESAWIHHGSVCVCIYLPIPLGVSLGPSHIFADTQLYH